jgi:hypothetical protein
MTVAACGSAVLVGQCRKVDLDVVADVGIIGL